VVRRMRNGKDDVNGNQWKTSPITQKRIG